MSRISIIVPIYKVEAYLNRCVDSILSQTYADFELILVDDGSPDNCGKICDKYAEKDSRVTVIHQDNSGLSVARNVGIEYALKTDSEWLTFIDSDDWIHPEYLNALYTAATSQNVMISVCGFQRTAGEEAEISDAVFDIFTPEKLWCKHLVNATVAWGKLYRKDLFRTIRYPVGKIHEDEYTTYLLLFSCEKIAFSCAEFYFYYQNQTGIMKSEWTPKRLDAIQGLENQLSYFSKHNYPNALRISAISYLSLLNNTLDFVKGSEQYHYLTSKLQSNFKKGIIKYKKVIPVTAKTHYRMLSNAFPFEMKVRDYFLALKQGISNDGFWNYLIKKLKKLFSH